MKLIRGINMRLIERLTADYNNGKFANGMTMKIDYRSDGNRYCYYINNELYMMVKQATSTHGTFERFIAEHSIEVKDITEHKSMWNDNWRNEHGCNPTEKAPSFKSKW